MQSVLFPRHSSGLSMRECGAQGLLAVTLCAPFHNLPPRWVHPPHLALSPLCPGCLSPPLLPVWTNVSSLSPWSSDFRVVQFSVSSGCFFILNCSCPSFCCARRHRVSTYVSILVFPRLCHFLNPHGNQARQLVFFPLKKTTVPEQIISLGSHSE